MSMTQRQSRTIRGFTLTEIAIVLGIIGLILGAVWAAASSVYLNMRVSTTSQQLLAMAQGIQNVHATRSQFDADTTGVVLGNAAAYPADVFANGAFLTNAFGGNYAVNVQTVGTRNGYSISFSNIPTAACTKLLLANFGGNNTQSIRGYTVAAANPAAYAAPASDVAPTPVQAIDACDDQDMNSVSFFFQLGS